MNDKKRFDDLAALLQKMAAERSKDPFQKPGTFVFSEQDRSQVDRVLPREALRPDQDMVSSALVPPGKAYFVEKPTHKWPDIKVDISIDPEVWRRTSEALARVAESLMLNAQFFDVTPARRPRPYRWQRGIETVTQWGDRLFERGLLDDPQIRWDYQKAVFKAIGSMIVGAMARLRGAK